MNLLLLPSRYVSLGSRPLSEESFERLRGRLKGMEVDAMSYLSMEIHSKNSALP
jgi:hypothetical protein